MVVNKSSIMDTYLRHNIQTGIGEVAVKVPRVRDRGKEDIKFSSNLIIMSPGEYIVNKKLITLIS